jgi:hypothetical protein
MYEMPMKGVAIASMLAAVVVLAASCREKVDDHRSQDQAARILALEEAVAQEQDRAGAAERRQMVYGWIALGLAVGAVVMFMMGAAMGTSTPNRRDALSTEEDRHGTG